MKFQFQCESVIESKIQGHLSYHIVFYKYSSYDYREIFFVSKSVYIFWVTLYLVKCDIHISVHCNIITDYSQEDAYFPEFIYFYRRSTCFRRFFRPSSGANICTYSFRYCQPILLLAATVEEVFHLAASSSVGSQYLKLYVQIFAPDDGRRNRLKHLERL
jgi:hypothetical protein